jgi:hypothetical protein
MSQVSLMLLDSGRHYLLRTLGERIKDRLRKRLYTSILQQEIGFFDANGKGELMSMLGEDVSQMQMAVTDRITSTLTNLTTVVFGAYKVVGYAHHPSPKRNRGSVVHRRLRRNEFNIVATKGVNGRACAHANPIVGSLRPCEFQRKTNDPQNPWLTAGSQHLAQGDSSRRSLRPRALPSIHGRAGI